MGDGVRYAAGRSGLAGLTHIELLQQFLLLFSLLLDDLLAAKVTLELAGTERSLIITGS